MRQCHFNGVAGTQLFGLFYPVDVAFDLFQYQFLAMADDDTDAGGVEALRGIDDALYHGLAADLVQYFRQFGIHARAFARSKNNDMQIGIHSFKENSVFK